MVLKELNMYKDYAAVGSHQQAKVINIKSLDAPEFLAQKLIRKDPWKLFYHLCIYDTKSH